MVKGTASAGVAESPLKLKLHKQINIHMCTHHWSTILLVGYDYKLNLPLLH